MNGFPGAGSPSSVALSILPASDEVFWACEGSWASPASAAFHNNSLFFTGLRGEALYQAVLRGNGIAEFKEHFKGQFGRLREVVTGPDGMLYITTSNQDGRGDPVLGDDKIIKVNPGNL